MASIEMASINKSFGTSRALEDLSLEVASGEFVSLLGPSGCGKTTALRILAGFENPDAGSVRVDGLDVTRIRPEKRRFGMVFQDYSLFPNMTARQNIEFGLKAQRATALERSSRTDRMIEMTRLEEHAAKYPHQMSGGQKQRVALARALATAPRVLLLDEPLSALDAQVRESLRDEIRSLQQELGITTVFVTHDQQEALAIADRVAVMSEGRLEQIAPPRELYEKPASGFVANFIGKVNRLRAIRQGGDHWTVLGMRVTPVRSIARSCALAAVRPEHLLIERSEAARARVTAVTFMGPITRVHVSDPDGGLVVVDVLSSRAANVRVDDRVRVVLAADVPPVLLLETEES